MAKRSTARTRGPAIFTIGHSTHPLATFIAMIEARGVRQLVDVRTIPRSLHNPQFEGTTLAAALLAHGIAYSHAAALGGLRHARKDSINGGWRNASFRGYADYMQTPEFARALDALLATAATAPTAIMCAEAVPWRCHRNLIADALRVRGVPVRHIMSLKTANPHELTSFAKAAGTTLTYPAAA